MPMYLMHKAAIEETERLLGLASYGQVKYDLQGYKYAMSADFDPIWTPHGYDFDGGYDADWRPYERPDNIFKRIEAARSKMLLHENKLFNYKRAACVLIHLITDAFTIGQMSKSLWGAKDNLMDAAMELVPDKKKISRENKVDPLSFEHASYGYKQNAYLLIESKIEFGKKFIGEKNLTSSIMSIRFAKMLFSDEFRIYARSIVANAAMAAVNDLHRLFLLNPVAATLCEKFGSEAAANIWEYAYD